jgi:hypothetical protein
MVKVLCVSRIDEDPRGTIDQIRIAIVGNHRFPDEGVNVIVDLHGQGPLDEWLCFEFVLFFKDGDLNIAMMGMKSSYFP